jgi:hypothetical protein
MSYRISHTLASIIIMTNPVKTQQFWPLTRFVVILIAQKHSGDELF